MTRTSRLLGAVSATALVALSASPALAEGTDAGIPITNTVTVSYQVNGVDQTDETATDEFVVDRKVNMTVTEVGGTATLVTPGGIEQVATFSVTNLSNDAVDFALSIAQQSGGAGAHSGTDNFDTGTVAFYIDDDGTAGYSAGDTEVTYLDGVAADDSVTVFVVTSIPVTQVNGDIATVILSATAHDGATNGSLGAVLSTSATNVVDQVDTVLADGTGATDGDYDGVFSARDDYRVQAALLSVLKTSSIISDGVSGPGDTPKAIPGATVRYCIAVSNGAGGQTATSITVSDILPAGMSFVTGSILLNGSVGSGGVCNTDGTAGGTFAAGEVSGTLSDIAAAETLTLVFDATID
jgi:uncharacterized repeat protein (TIGR01451 family)